MAKGRNNGCPTNIRDWQVSILDQAAAGENWVRIMGLNTLTRSVETETADGSAGSDLWQEPYVTKRAVKVKLSGRAVGCIASGETDPGQRLLDSYADQAGCEGDATLRFVDPYCHAMVADFVVTASERQAGKTETAVSWELRQVGEAETLPYKQVQSVALTPDVLTLRVGETARVGIRFTPGDASNRRYRVRLEGAGCAALSQIEEEGFSVTGLAQGTATVQVISLNGQKTAALAVTVEA